MQNLKVNAVFEIEDIHIKKYYIEVEGRVSFNPINKTVYQTIKMQMPLTEELNKYITENIEMHMGKQIGDTITNAVDKEINADRSILENNFYM